MRCGMQVALLPAAAGADARAWAEGPAQNGVRDGKETGRTMSWAGHEAGTPWIGPGRRSVGTSGARPPHGQKPSGALGRQWSLGATELFGGSRPEEGVADLRKG